MVDVLPIKDQRVGPARGQKMMAVGVWCSSAAMFARSISTITPRRRSIRGAGSNAAVAVDAVRKSVEPARVWPCGTAGGGRCAAAGRRSCRAQHPTEVVSPAADRKPTTSSKGAAACLKPGLVGVSAVEHPCVLKPALQLARQGWQLRQLAVDSEGRVNRDSWLACVADKPALLSVMSANNETGVLQDVSSLAATARTSGALLHSDAVQVFGKLPLWLRERECRRRPCADGFGAQDRRPEGAAALVLDKRVEISPLIAGGGHGVGFVRVPRTWQRSSVSGSPHSGRLRCWPAMQRGSPVSRCPGDRSAIAGCLVFGAGAARLPNTSYFALPDIDGETLVGKAGSCRLRGGQRRCVFECESGAVAHAAGGDGRGAGDRPRCGAREPRRGHDAAADRRFLNTLRTTAVSLHELTAMSA